MQPIGSSNRLEVVYGVLMDCSGAEALFGLLVRSMVGHQYRAFFHPVSYVYLINTTFVDPGSKQS